MQQQGVCDSPWPVCLVRAGNASSCQVCAVKQASSVGVSCHISAQYSAIIHNGTCSKHENLDSRGTTRTSCFICICLVYFSYVSPKTSALFLFSKNASKVCCGDYNSYCPDLPLVPVSQAVLNQLMGRFMWHLFKGLSVLCPCLTRTRLKKKRF